MKLSALDRQPLPTRLYTAQQVRDLDRAAIASGIPGIRLMKRAGRAAFALLLERYPAPSLITVYCGTGNNAGDGYVLAGLAAQRRLPVQVIQVGAPSQLQGDALLAFAFAEQEGVNMHPLDDQPPATGVVVDALLGTGLRGELRAPIAQAIEQINASGLPVLALDVPSGLDSDTGAVAGVAVAAQMTATFIGLKRGLLTGRGPALSGAVYFTDLAVPESCYQQVPAALARLDLPTLLTALPVRAADAHKGDFGHVMVIGGDSGYGGAALLAAEAAARTGAGLVSVATRPEHVSAMLARRPELMACGVTSGQELEPLLARPTLLVVGPGLGSSPWSEQMLQQAAKTGLPMVLDADALNLLAQGRVLPGQPRRDNWVLTPHPGEAARLLGVTTADIQRDRFAAAQQLQARFGGTVVLKGAGSLVATAEGLGLVSEGNPGMASGGMGDVLSGVIGALLAQGLSTDLAAQLGASLHASAADLAAGEWGERGLLAADLLPCLCQLMSEH